MDIGPSCWWDQSWNVSGGCKPLGAECINCYAPPLASNLLADNPLYDGITDLTDDGRRVFNGKTTVLPPGHPTWTLPLRYPGAAAPRLGPGKPSLIFVADMSDQFFKQPPWVFDKIADTICASVHIGLLLTRRPSRMKGYFTVPRSPLTLRRQQECLWLGFSAGNQEAFDQRWPYLRSLAERGWCIFVSLAPMLGPVLLPPDLLSLGDRVWIICAGEEGPHEHCRDMDTDWPRALRDQCVPAGIPFFFKQMARLAPIPLDLMIRQFPAWPRPTREI